MVITLFEGRTHKITTDGKTFFLYIADGRKWHLRDSNSMSPPLYKEALKDIRELLSMNMPEEEKMLKLLQSGFFSASNL